VNNPTPYKNKQEKRAGVVGGVVSNHSPNHNKSQKPDKEFEKPPHDTPRFRAFSIALKRQVSREKVLRVLVVLSR
jgi:hypothetical protein